MYFCIIVPPEFPLDTEVKLRLQKHDKFDSFTF